MFLFIQVNLHDHIKRTETICQYLQSIEKLQTDIDSKVNALDELRTKMTESIDQHRFLEIVQVSD